MSPGHNLRRPTLSCPATLPFNISLRVKLNQLLGLNHRRAKASKGLAAPAQVIPRQILRVLCAICYQGDRLLRCKAPSPYHKPPPCPPPHFPSRLVRYQSEWQIKKTTGKLLLLALGISQEKQEGVAPARALAPFLLQTLNRH